jgi:hypothetical protein
MFFLRFFSDEVSTRSQLLTLIQRCTTLTIQTYGTLNGMACDQIKLHMPMPFRLIKGRKSQAGRVAVMRGPTLFCLNPERQEDFDPDMMRLMWLDPASVTLSGQDTSIRPDGLTCQALFWPPTNYNAAGKATIKLTLTEYPDPGCQATYFLVPNPRDEALADDELEQKWSGVH